MLKAMSFPHFSFIGFLISFAWAASAELSKIGESTWEMMDGRQRQLSDLYTSSTNILMLVRSEAELREAFTAVTLIESYPASSKPDWLIVAILPEEKIERLAIKRALKSLFKSELSRERIAISTTKETALIFKASPAIPLARNQTLLIVNDGRSYQRAAEQASMANASP